MTYLCFKETLENKDVVLGQLENLLAMFDVSTLGSISDLEMEFSRPRVLFCSVK